MEFDLLSRAARKSETEIRCQRVVPNHAHLIAVSAENDNLRATFADAHRRWTGSINARLRATGHTWQGRFGSVVLDEARPCLAVRYVSVNHVRAKLVPKARGWRWASAVAQPLGQGRWIAESRTDS